MGAVAQASYRLNRPITSLGPFDGGPKRCCRQRVARGEVGMDEAADRGAPEKRDRRGWRSGEEFFRPMGESVKDYAIFVLDPQGGVAS